MALDVVYVQRPVGDYAIAIAVPQSLLQYLLVTLQKKNHSQHGTIKNKLGSERANNRVHKLAASPWHLHRGAAARAAWSRRTGWETLGSGSARLKYSGIWICTLLVLIDKIEKQRLTFVTNIVYNFFRHQ
jgi:hypothetical protein